MFIANDAGQAAEAFLISQLTYIEPQVYRIRYPNIRYPEIVPVDTSAPAWIPSVTYFSIDGVGKASWFNGRANDVPLAEVQRTKYETPVKMAAIGYEYDLEELNQAIMLGRDLNVDKAYYARLAAEEFIDNAALYGDSTAGASFTGLVNNSGVTQAAVANGAAASPLWTSKTASEILKDVNTALGGPAVATSGVEMADTLLLPWTQFNLVSSTQVANTSNQTILNWLLENNVFTARTGMPLKIVPVWSLETAGSGATARMVAYWRDPTVVKMHLPMPFQFVGGVWRDGPMLYKVPGAFRFGGVDVRRPAAFRYYDGI
jgi:hypothetical protein